MKKNILIILTLLLLTGCTCEYNLTINGNSYKEEITITGENSEEISNFNQEWAIPIDKNEYDMAGDESTELSDIKTDIYNYTINSNNIKFYYDLSRTKLINSTAVSQCYNMLNISNYNNTIIISTSPKNDCFDKYPPLSNLKVTINILNKQVISNNADNINGNIYTWNITKENASNKSINLVLDNGIQNEEIIDDEPVEKPKKEKDYTLYIFCAILLIIMLLVYAIVSMIKNRKDEI